MPNLLVELFLRPDADASFLTTSAEAIQQPALQVKGVLATRNLSFRPRDRGGVPPDRLVLNVWGETFDTAQAFAHILGAWTGVERVSTAEIISPEDIAAFGLLDGTPPALPSGQ